MRITLCKSICEVDIGNGRSATVAVAPCLPVSKGAHVVLKLSEVAKRKGLSADHKEFFLGFGEGAELLVRNLSGGPYLVLPGDPIAVAEVEDEER